MPFDLDWVRRRLPGRDIGWFPTIDSTMIEASRLAAAGCAGGTAVVAGQQTAGQGRHGRKWHSEPDSGLYVSVVLRFPFGVETFPGMTLAVGLAAREAIFDASGVLCDLRWPNDLLFGEKKCGGILLNLESQAVVAGVGINVNHAAFPAELATMAGSLRLATGRPQSRERVLVELLEAMDRYCRLVQAQGIDPVLRLFTQASSYASGRRVVVEQGGIELTGTTAGLDAHGFLLLQQDNGRIVTILAGGVRPA